MDVEKVAAAFGVAPEYLANLPPTTYEVVEAESRRVVESIAHGAPGSFVRRVQEDPTIAVELLRACRELYDAHVKQGASFGFNDDESAMLNRAENALKSADGDPWTDTAPSGVENPAALRERCALAVEAEKICDEDLEHDRQHGHGKENDAYNMAIRHAAAAVRALTVP